LVADLDDDDTNGAGVVGGRQTEAGAQIDERNALAAPIDHAFDERWRARDPGDLLHADDLVDAGDFDAVELDTQLEDDKLPLVATGHPIGGLFFYRYIHQFACQS